MATSEDERERLLLAEERIRNINENCTDRHAVIKEDHQENETDHKRMLDKLDTWVPKRQMYLVAGLTSALTLTTSQLIAHILEERDRVLQPVGSLMSPVVAAVWQAFFG